MEFVLVRAVRIREDCRGCQNTDVKISDEIYEVLVMSSRHLFIGLVLILSSPAFAKDKGSSVEDAIREEIRDEIGDVDHGDNSKGKGRPDNPGEHGRENAAQKQRVNPGQGSKGGDSREDLMRYEFEHDDEKGGKNKNKNKNKDKNKKN